MKSIPQHDLFKRNLKVRKKIKLVRVQSHCHILPLYAHDNFHNDATHGTLHYFFILNRLETTYLI